MAQQGLSVLTAIACIFFAAFVVTRAVRVALTYDEAATYIKYISTNPLSIFNFAYATNHFLNTLLARVFYVVGGNHDLMLRMPSVLGYGMYLAFSLLMLSRLTSRTVAFAGLLLLNLNAYALEYFALSRGYGLSLGLLMGSVFFLLEFLTRLRTNLRSASALSWSLWFATGAVLANFSLLNVYISIVVIAVAAAAVANRVIPAAASFPLPFADPAPAPRRTRRWLPIAAAGFTLLVFSQDIGLSGALYAPVVVRLAGLNEAELDAVRVVRVDFRGLETALPRHADGWYFDSPVHVSGLRVELPVALAEKTPTIEAVLGTRPFPNDSQGGVWTRRDIGATRMLESTPALSLPKSRVPAFGSVINWGGDARYLEQLAAHTAVGLVLLGAITALVTGLGHLSVRLRLLTADQRRVLTSRTLWLMALVGSPLYILRRDGELYFGGSDGLVQDTFSSLINNSFHGEVYHAAQTSIVLETIAASVAAFLIVGLVQYRRHRLQHVIRGSALLGLLLLVSTAVLVQHAVLSTPYLLGRTALFYIPLYVLFAVFLCDSLADLGRVGKACAACVLTVALAMSLYHFRRTANIDYVWDWPRDAGTKAMIDDLATIVASERPSGPPAILEVYWESWPVAAVYAGRNTRAGIDVVAEPSLRGSDFRYVKDEGLSDAAVLRRYPEAGSLLTRTK